MTELERARAHLRECQDSLSTHRRMMWCLEGKRLAQGAERRLLAALSWVWDAQERATQLSEPVWCAWDFGTEDSWHKRMFMAAKATAEVLDASQGA